LTTTSDPVKGSDPACTSPPVGPAESAAVVVDVVHGMVATVVVVGAAVEVLEVDDVDVELGVVDVLELVVAEMSQGTIVDVVDVLEVEVVDVVELVDVDVVAATVVVVVLCAAVVVVVVVVEPEVAVGVQV